MNNRAPIDFKSIAEAALSRAKALVEDWVPGGDWSGHEYKPRNPTRDDRHSGSFVINTATGKWIDNATDDKGGDLISLYAYLFGMDQVDAAREVAATVGIDLDDGALDCAQRTAAKSTQNTQPIDQNTKKPKTFWKPILPAPADAGDRPKAHYVRGHPEAVWTYLDAHGLVNGYVYRFRTSDGGKETLPLCFAENGKTGKREWRWMAFPEPRPLYGLDQLVLRPNDPVLLVEGEKCADAAREKYPDAVAVSWAGGCKAVGKSDFSPLYDRDVTAWPDCDAQRMRPAKGQKIKQEDMPLLPEDKQPGMRAMLQIRDDVISRAPDTSFKLVDIPVPGTKPDGWDVADAIDEGMSADDLRAFINNIRGDAKPSAKTIPSRSEAAAGEKWSAGDLFWKGRDIVACMANVFDIFQHDKEWRGVIAYDAFAYQINKLKPPPYVGAETGEWTEQDDAQASMWMTRKYGFAPSVKLVAEAVESCAKYHAYNPVHDYLNGLKWDGISRVDDWVSDYIGAPKTEYIWRVSRWYLIGMVARAMQPGVKFDYCLVLEGEQGRMKSAAFRVLGGRWFGDTDLDLQNKDSMSAVRGKWLYEFAELGSLARAESTRQKSFLSRQVDEFRPVYGRREIRSPRQLVFGGTTNEWEWNKDTTGGRRFWPVYCDAPVNQEGLAEARDQLFAEAFHLYNQGERYWPTSEEQKDIFDHEQFKRSTSDSFLDLLHDWVYQQVSPFSLADAADHLKIDAPRLTKDIQTRVGKALQQLGCTRTEKRTHIIRYWYKPPTRNAARSETGSGDNGGGSVSIPF